jgi:hypothetical protein
MNGGLGGGLYLADHSGYESVYALSTRRVRILIGGVPRLTLIQRCLEEAGSSETRLLAILVALEKRRRLQQRCRAKH